MAKKKQMQTTIKSWDEANEVIGRIAVIEAELQANEAGMNEELQRIREKYEAQTAELRQAKLMHEVNLSLFSEANKSFFEGRIKSKKLFYGVIGFSFNPPRVALLNKKFNWDTVKALLKDRFGKKYLRESVEVNKDKLIADVTGKLKLISDADLAAVGLKIDQKEKFYYKINWESIEGVKKVG